MGAGVGVVMLGLGLGMFSECFVARDSKSASGLGPDRLTSAFGPRSGLSVSDSGSTSTAGLDLDHRTSAIGPRTPESVSRASAVGFGPRLRIRCPVIGSWIRFPGSALGIHM